MKYEDTTEKTSQGTILHVRVVPNAGGYSAEYDEWRHEIKVRVKAQPREGKANRDLIDYLSRFFTHPLILSGEMGRSKKVLVSDTWGDTMEILEELLG
ncbi:MAG: YggU family protein [Theionarchaea archaeon]|nr:YggU family protein [Theionarchaea archaeon]